MEALIIFARNPVAGNVKTRIAKTLGTEAALNIYKNLLNHTRSVTKQLAIDKFIFYADYINDHDLWDSGYNKHLQHGLDLGERMSNAFRYVFQQGYQKVVIIGSDCFDLKQTIIEQAIESLQHHDVAVGPSTDGGYYLLGLRSFHPELFENKQWSTNTVCSNTLDDIRLLGLSFEMSPTLSDVDTAEDVNRYNELLKTSI